MNKTKAFILVVFFAVQIGADAGAEMNLDFLPQENFSMELADADVRNIVHIIGVTYNINFLVNSAVAGTMTVNFKDVPIRDAFTSILKNFELGFTRDGNIIRIDSFSSLETKKVNASLVTRPIHVKYTFDSTESISGKGESQGLTELAESLEELLSKRAGAGISVIRRTNTLLVTDVLESVDRIEKLIIELDRKTKQIKIMARIIEANTDFTQQLGVSWGGALNGRGKDTFKARGGKKSILLTDTISPEGTLPTTKVFSREGVARSGQAFMQNAASLVGQGALSSPGGASIDFLIGKITSNFLDLQLSAMEKDGTGKILSSPKIITQNNMMAMIKSGLRVPIQTVEEGTVTVKYEDALLRMDALPHIIDGGIFLDLKIIKDDVDDTRQRIAGNPFLTNNEITTKVLVNDGETVVIGGLITQREVDSMTGIPYLSRIPLLGWLFRFEEHFNKKTELLIFITPSILKDS